MKKNYSIPSKFELLPQEEVHNSNFKKVKLYIQSDGENYNGSSFSVESMINAMETIDYIPILGYVVENEEGYDFDGHNVSYDLAIDNQGEMTIIENFDEVPIGVVTNQGCYIEHLNGKNFLVAYGYIWKSYSNHGIKILERDMEKEVSMEILVEEGNFTADGVYAISKYEIQGVTVLGKSVPAAIEGSKIQMSFSQNDEYRKRVEEINTLLQNFCKEGGNEMEENKDILPEVEEVVEPQEFAEEEKVCPECNKPVDECECEKEDEEMAKKKKRKCSEEECEEEFSEEQEEVKEEPQEEEFSENDAVEIPVVVEEKLYTQEDMDKAIADAKAEFASMVEELEALREFKAEYDAKIELQQLNETMDELEANFNVDPEVVKGLREKVVNKEMSLDMFELNLYRNNSPIKKEFKKEDKQTKLPVIDSNEKVSEVDKLFKKFGL